MVLTVSGTGVTVCRASCAGASVGAGAHPGLSERRAHRARRAVLCGRPGAPARPVRRPGAAHGHGACLAGGGGAAGGPGAPAYLRGPGAVGLVYKMIRSKRKINKLRGSRSNGGGCTKKRRGAGNKGGRGNAGASKQHWTWTAKFDPDHYGKHGFKRPQKMIKKVNPVNLSYLEEQADNLIESGKASKDGDSIVIDVTELGYDKVLAKGKITKSFIISAPQFSASAIEKIEEMGGEAIEL